MGIAIPLMVTEILLGRRGLGSPLHAMRHLAKEAGHHRAWQLLGGLGILVGFLLLSCYSVIAGWTLPYVMHSALGTFSGQAPLEVTGVFGDLVSTPELLLLCHTLFMAMTMWIVACGVRSGLARAARYMVPALFAVLLVLIAYAMNSGDFGQGVAALFIPDFSKLTLNSVLSAMEYSLFTLAVGTGAIMSYGAYLPNGISVVKTTLVIASADLLATLLAGMAIFPLLFVKGIEPGAGPGLVFQTLPIVFGQMPYGSGFGALFFLLLVLAAWSTLMAFAEPVVAWLVESRGMTRRVAAWWVGGSAWLLGIGSVLSFNRWAHEPYLLFGKTFFYRLDYLTSNIMIPLGALMVAIFASRLMRPGSVAEELGPETGVLFRSWRFLVRFVVPIAVLIVFLHATGVIQFE
jgi:NSS family neurotransmitter:Na+ symporter